MSNILEATNEQFRLAEDGQVSFQSVASNPLPGEAIGHLQKSDDILKPEIVIHDNALTKDVDQAALKTRLGEWFAAHLKTVLEPLVELEETGELKPAVVEIANTVHAALGIVPREDLEDFIVQLDADDRKDLRSKKIRLGPILVFIPALNKPAAVRLRALLWGLYNDKDLPMECPKDGIVSFAVDEAAIDKSFYQAIAYPVYGGRAIRIDMLDRVISAVYDAADKGKFQAQHKMAEWLGSSIEGLYAVLEAMGHTKIYDPADEKKDEEAQVDESAKPMENDPIAVDEGEDKVPEEPKTDEVKVQEQIKPELATFRLKKGKAFEKKQAGGKSFSNNKKPFNKKKNEKPKGKRNKSTNRQPKIMSVGPEKKMEDSPFAVLEQLKQKK